MGLRLMKVHAMAQRKSKELWLVQDNLKKIEKGDLLLFSVMKNESHRLPFFWSIIGNWGWIILYWWIMSRKMIFGGSHQAKKM